MIISMLINAQPRTRVEGIDLCTSIALTVSFALKLSRNLFGLATGGNWSRLANEFRPNT